MFDYNWDFSFVPHYFGILGKGIWTTMLLSFWTIFFSTIFGVFVGILSSRKMRWIKAPTILMIDTIRSIPIIILILWVYYAFPVLGLHVEAFYPTIVALIINNSAFIGDLVRGGIEGIPKGSAIAGHALGMDKKTVLLRIVLPEVFREIFPAVTLMYISIIKLTSLASIVAVYEITHVGEWIISSTFKPLEVYTVIGGIYLILILPLTLLSRLFEKSSYFKRRTV